MHSVVGAESWGGSPHAIINRMGEGMGVFEVMAARRLSWKPWKPDLMTGRQTDTANGTHPVANPQRLLHTAHSTIA
jgi:hypothetical protein